MANKKEFFKFSFRQLLTLYLVGVLAIIIAIFIAWPKWAKHQQKKARELAKFKQKMTKEHNAKALKFSGVDTTDKDLIKLKRLSYITELNLGLTKISDLGLVHLKSLTRLTKLWLSYTKISDSGLMHLKPLTNLKEFHLSWTKVSDSGLIHLKPLTNLTELYLFNTKVSKTGITKLKMALPNCSIYSDFGIF